MSMPVVVRKVWQHNLDEEVSAILRALPDYPFVAMDTSFPGRVFTSQILTPYQLMKLNVESTKLIQLGIALCDVNGNLAICDANDEKSCCCWEFNFRGFDQHIQFYNKESIELLNRQEIDFQKNRDMGIDPSVFRKLMSKCDLLHNSQISWFTFDSAYDFGYFVRLLRYKENLPLYVGDFLLLVEDYFGGAVFDIKHMIKYCDGLFGGLERVAKTLGVYRVVGKSHQAGSNSLLTLQTFMKLKQVYFNGRSTFAGRFQVCYSRLTRNRKHQLMFFGIEK
jgi:CCR4-NOT transcription complex subunit 7/8